MLESAAPSPVLDLDAFSYLVAHELGPPLRRLAKLASLVQPGGDTAEGAEEPDDMQTVQTGQTAQAAQAAQTIQAVQALQAEVQGLQAFVDGVRRFAQPAGADGPTVDTRDALIDAWVPHPGFHLELQEDLPALPMPPLHVATVFRALLENAVLHHHKPRGMVTVSGGVDGGTWLEFRDDGPGLPSSLERLCEPFWPRAHPPAGAGVGVGLALCRHILAHYGGRLQHTPSSAGSVLRIQF